MSFTDNLAKILQKQQELSNRLTTGITGDEFVKASREYSELEPIVQKINEYNKSLSDFADTKELEQELKDPEAEEMIQAELSRLELLIPRLEREVKIALLPKDEADSKSAIIGNPVLIVKNSKISSGFI
jgi:peptide chain release factor 1